MKPRTRIPIVLLTGFLGSGKTTLLRQMLTLPGWQDTVVLVNELGEVGLDHHLLGTASDSVMLMNNGCICCSVRDDLIGVLEELFWKRLHRQMPAFTRVVVETTGLADPGPIIDALLSHALIAQRYALDSVLCTVDATGGMAQLSGAPELTAQVAAADCLLLTKTDLADAGDSFALEAALCALNPVASLRRTCPGNLSPGLLEAIVVHDRQRLRLPPLPSEPTGGSDAAQLPDAAQSPAMRYLHHNRVMTTTLRFAGPWEWEVFDRAVHALLARHGAQIYRLKGWLDVTGVAGPTVVQAVRKTLYAPEQLTAWPGGKRESFLVCITNGVTPEAVRAAFAQPRN